MTADGFSQRLARLKEASSWDREDLIAEGDWLRLPGIEEAASGAAELCAERLAAMEVPTGEESAPAQDADTAAG